MGLLGRIVYLSEEQKNTLFSSGSVTSDGTTVTYSDNDLYITPDTSISDVQVNGTSVVTNHIANIQNIQTISGTTPSITAAAGMQYICGECSTLSVTLPASGRVNILFTSGSTPTALTLTPPTGVAAIKWSSTFDPTNLDTETTYEINILNGQYGIVNKWT